VYTFGDVQALAAPPSSVQVIDETALESLTLNATDTDVVVRLCPSVGDTMFTVGATRSTTNV
jgi:hypothetical protein